MNSLYLDHCWVCGERFTDANPPGSQVRHEHHMVPRAFGGVDGPTISLCDTHHSTLHKVAVYMKSEKPYFTLLTGNSEVQRKKILYLANIVYNAELQTRNDPNKSASVMMALNLKHKTMIDRLRKVYPKTRGREDVLHVALESLYRKHFTD